MLREPSNIIDIIAGPFGVSAEILEEIGGPNVFNDTVKLRKDQGAGYMVDVAVFHHLHCVVSLFPLL